MRSERKECGAEKKVQWGKMSRFDHGRWTVHDKKLFLLISRFY